MTRAVLLAVLLAGCVSAPQFELGPEVAPPQGCVEARARGHDC